MDWFPIVEPFIGDLHLKDFRYNIRRAAGTDVPTVLSYQGGVFKIIQLQDNDDWDSWFQSELFKGGHLNSPDQPPEQAQGRSGFQILLSPRVEPATIAGRPVIRRHYNLPFPKECWKRVTETFLLHRAVLYASRNNRCQSTFLARRHNNQNLELHTAAAAAFDRPGSFSLSCTYFSASRLSLAVLYSCDSDQVERVKQLVQVSPEVASHPLLMVGIFAELQLGRMKKLLGEVRKLLDENRVHLLRIPAPKPLTMWELNQKLAIGVQTARKAEEEMRAVQANLNDTASHIDEWKEGWKYLAPSWEETQIGKSAPVMVSVERYKSRFRDLQSELDEMMAECRVAAEQQTYDGELFLAELQRLQAVTSNQEARASRRQARLSKVLALFATIYLPMTSVATIFAVPAFKFENYWMDGRFTPVNSSSSTSSSASDDNGLPLASEPLKPVFSGYGVIYILVSALLTGITVGGYLLAKRRRADDDDEDGTALVFVKDDQGKVPTKANSGGTGNGSRRKGILGPSNASSVLSTTPQVISPGSSGQGALGQVKALVSGFPATLRRIRNKVKSEGSPV